MGACSSASHNKDEDDKVTLDTIPHTMVPPEYFAAPVPLSVSGGTAQFFSLNYIGPSSGPAAETYGGSSSYWLGKDVERALDELPFYEALLKLDLRKYKLLKDWTITYAGVLEAQVAKSKTKLIDLEDEERNLLVIHDIAHGLVEKRMLDIKLGEETGVAGWQGKTKSKWKAKQTRVIDGHTNSTVEGYRLEGFDNKPTSLLSQERGDFHGFPSKCKFLGKKTNRLQLQRLPLRDFCTYWTDMNDMEDMYTDSSMLTVAENSEAVLFDTVRQLAQMCADMSCMPTAQMWIGSSLCLACDSGRLLERHSTLKQLARPRPEGPSMQAEDIAKVCLFDWGRSELNTLEMNETLTEEEQFQRKRYWIIWQRGLARCFFEAANLYLTQFCFKPEVITLEAWDFDSFDPNDLLGVVDLPLQATDGPVELDLSDDAGTVTVEVTEMPVPSPSRLQQIWRIYVYSVSGLPKSDVWTDTDPVIRAKVGAENGCRAQADTPVVWDDHNAEIEHPLYVGLASRNTQMSFISGMSSIFGTNVSPELFILSPDQADSKSKRQQKYEAFLSSVPLFSSLVEGI